MLQNLRKHAQGWVAAFIVIILCFAFALWGIEYYLGGNQQETALVEVNGEKITSAQIDSLYKRLRHQTSEGNNILFSQERQKLLKSQATQQLVAQYVLSDAASKEGYVVSNQQIGSILAQIPAFQLNAQFSPELFRRTIFAFFPTEQAFLTDIKQNAQIIQAKIGMVDSDFALPNEVNQAIRLLEQKRDVSFLTIPMAHFLPEIKLSDQEVAAYYKAHQQQFMSQETVKIAYIEISGKNLASTITVSEPEILQYYNENKASFQTKPFNAVHDQIVGILKQQKIEQLLAQQSDQLTNLTYTNPDTLKVASDSLKLPIQTSDFFGHQGAASGVAANPKVVAVAFSGNVLKQGNNSDLISLDDQTALVLRVQTYKPAALRPLGEVRPQIEQKLKAQAAQTAAQQQGQTIIAALKKGQSFDQIATQYHLLWNQKQMMGRQATDIPIEILNTAFKLPLPVESKPSIGGSHLVNGNYAVIVVTDFKNADPNALTSQQRQQIQQNLAKQFGILNYDLYREQKMQEAKIKYETPIL